MTTAADGAGLLDAIRGAPDDDAPRLVYADWLDEDGQSERAEFVRLQIELARHKRAKVMAEAEGKAWVDGMLLFSRREAIRARESDLVYDGERGPMCEFARLLRPRRIAWQWWKDVGCAQLQDLDDTSTVLCGRAFFRRGFSQRVECPLSFWQEHGPAIVRAHPVTRVELTDRGPWQGRDRPGAPARAWGWWADAAGPGQERWRLPVAVLNLLDCDPRRLPDLPVTYDGRDGTGGVFFGSAADCADATSDGLLAWARLSDEERQPRLTAGSTTHGNIPPTPAYATWGQP